MRQRLSRFHCADEGVAAVEFAIVGSVFIMVILGVIDLAVNLHRLHYVSFIADQAVRKVYISPAMSASDMQAWVTAYSDGTVTAVLGDKTIGQNGAERSLQLRAETDFVFLPVPATLDIDVLRTVPIVNPYF